MLPPPLNFRPFRSSWFADHCPFDSAAWAATSFVEWNIDGTISQLPSKFTFLWSWNSSCGRQSVDQSVWVSGLPSGPLTRFYLALLFSADNYLIFLSKAPSLTRKRVCSLQSLTGPNNHTLPSHLSLSTLFVASYDEQGLRWKYSNPPPHGATFLSCHSYHFYWLNCGACAPTLNR
jgi:hypothetical protein